ncbi:MAG: hypothetical protein ACRDB0_08440 [Paraclostridium sp.]
MKNTFNAIKKVAENTSKKTMKLTLKHFDNETIETITIVKEGIQNIRLVEGGTMVQIEYVPGYKMKAIRGGEDVRNITLSLFIEADKFWTLLELMDGRTVVDIVDMEEPKEASYTGAQEVKTVESDSIIDKYIQLKKELYENDTLTNTITTLRRCLKNKNKSIDDEKLKNIFYMFNRIESQLYELSLIENNLGLHAYEKKCEILKDIKILQDMYDCYKKSVDIIVEKDYTNNYNKTNEKRDKTMMKSESQVIINGAELTLIGEYENYTTSLSKTNFDMISEVKITDKEGNTVYQSGNNLCLVLDKIEELESEIIFAMDNHDKFGIKTNLITRLLDELFYKNIYTTFSMRIRNLKEQKEQQDKDEYFKNINEENKILKSELNTAIEKSDFIVNVTIDYIEIFKSLDDRVKQHSIEISDTQARNMYIKMLLDDNLIKLVETITESNTRYNTYNEIWNIQYKKAIEFLRLN